MSKKRNKTSGRVRKQANRLPAQQAKLALKQGNYDKALLLLQKHSNDIQEDQRKSALAELYFQRAYRLIESQPEQALGDLQQAAILQSKDALYAYHVGLAYQRVGQLNEAIEWYQNTLERDTIFTRAYFPLALALHMSGANIQEESVWQRLSDEQKAYLVVDHGSPDKLLQGLNAAASNNWASAEKHFQVIIADKRVIAEVRAIAHDYLGRNVLRQDVTALAVALKHWEQAYTAGLRSPTFLDNLALAYILHCEALLQNNDVTTVRKLIKQALQCFPTNSRLQEIQSHLLLDVGYDAAVANDWQGAVALWDEVQSAEGEVARRLAANLALAYEKLEQWSEAADSWREFARRRGRKEGAVNWLAPEQVARLWSRIATLYMRAGLEDEAITTLQTALKYDPDDLEMGIELANNYAAAERIEAAHNQIDRVLKKHSKSAKALSFKAELSEIAPQGWALVNHQAIDAWKKVIETGDESYVPIARQSLKELYVNEFDSLMSWGASVDKALNLVQDGLKLFPDFHYLRAKYVTVLFAIGKSTKEINKQISQIDLSDLSALHHLVDIAHIFDKPKMAADLLKKSQAKNPLSSQFYSGVATCAINREQFEVAEGYFGEALVRATTEDDTKHIFVDKAIAYDEVGEDDKAMANLKEVFKLDAKYGPAHIASAIISGSKGNVKDAKASLKKAEKWARETGDEEMAGVIEQMRAMIDNPFASMLPPGFFDMDFDDFDEDGEYE